MTVRRCITFYRLISGDLSLPPDLSAELVALVISILMVIGVAWIAPLFLSIRRSKDALARFAHQQSVVADLGSLVLEGGELQYLMDEAVRLTAEALGVEMCKILELEESGEALRLVAGVGWREGLVGEESVGAELASQAGYTLHKGEPVIVEDLRTESRFSGPPLLRDHNVVSGLSVPMVAGDFVFGVMGAHTTARRDFSEDDIHFLEAMANVVTTAVLRRQAEEAIRALKEFNENVVHSIQDGLVVLGRDFRITFWNKAMEEISGFEAEEVIGKIATEMFPHLIEHGVDELFRATLEGQVVMRSNIPYLTTKGKSGYTNVRSLPLKDQAGAVIGALVTVEDVTEVLSLEERVVQLQHEIEQRKLVEIAKGTLMREMSLSEAESYKLIQKRSRDENRKMGDVAKQIIDFFGMLEERKK